MSETDIKKLSKEELEQVGRENGIELDKRLLKSKMVKQLKEKLGEQKTVTPKSNSPRLPRVLPGDSNA